LFNSVSNEKKILLLTDVLGMLKKRSRDRLIMADCQMENKKRFKAVIYKFFFFLVELTKIINFSK